MQFRDLRKQYEGLKEDIDRSIAAVLSSAHFISGSQVSDLEQKLAGYVGVKHCITCGNGTDALTIALMAWGVGEGDAVFGRTLHSFHRESVRRASGRRRFLWTWMHVPIISIR